MEPSQQEGTKNTELPQFIKDSPQFKHTEERRWGALKKILH